jgi:hypothetical protein
VTRMRGQELLAVDGTPCEAEPVARVAARLAGSTNTRVSIRIDKANPADVQHSMRGARVITTSQSFLNSAIVSHFGDF